MSTQSPFSRRQLLSLVLPLAAVVCVGSAVAGPFLEIEVAPPPPRIEHHGERPGFVWAPGYWRWDGHHHVWEDGHWEAERRGHHWVPSHWEEIHGHHRFIEGHWD